MIRPERIIITGGPGSGKSTLIEVLRQRGYHCQQEASRKVIEAHQQQNISPWGDLEAFVELVYQHMIQELMQPAPSPTFCDRGVPDCEAYLKEAGLGVPGYLRQFNPHLHYAQEVFILPPWQQIYWEEPARLQSWQKAVALYESLMQTYEHWGFRLTEVPLLSVADRANFILQRINIEGRKEAWERI